MGLKYLLIRFISEIRRIRLGLMLRSSTSLGKSMQMRLISSEWMARFVLNVKKSLMMITTFKDMLLAFIWCQRKSRSSLKKRRNHQTLKQKKSSLSVQSVLKHLKNFGNSVGICPALTPINQKNTKIKCWPATEEKQKNNHSSLFRKK